MITLWSLCENNCMQTVCCRCWTCEQIRDVSKHDMIQYYYVRLARSLFVYIWSSLFARRKNSAERKKCGNYK